MPHTASPDVSAANGMTVSANDAATVNATITLGATLSSGQGIAGAVSFNDVSGGATAHADNTAITLTGGALMVTATEAATITADTKSEVTASSSNSSGMSGGSSYGGGKSLGASGTLGVNVVQGAATATVTGSTVTATAAAGEDVTVSADNKLTLTANSTAAASISTGSSTQSAALSLGLNVLGYDSAEGVLFATLDALLGVPAFDTTSDAGASASLFNTTVNASGKVIVNAVNESKLTATMNNTTTASSSGTQGAQASSPPTPMPTSPIPASTPRATTP